MVGRKSPAINSIYRRNSLRLKGYDYSQVGGYFVTICAAGRRCIFGEVVEGRIRLSEIGRIVELCWRNISTHFPNTKVDTFQIMPNHVHGIVKIKEHSCRGVQLNAPTGNHFSGISPRKNTLGVIIRTFKGAVTSEVRKTRKAHVESIWQRSFYDHIIRDDVDHFFVERYIELNPIMWELDADNPKIREVSIQALRNTLREKYGLDGSPLERAIEYESGYRRNHVI